MSLILKFALFAGLSQPARGTFKVSSLLRRVACVPRLFATHDAPPEGRISRTSEICNRGSRT
jgi:hypothetical protein